MDSRIEVFVRTALQAGTGVLNPPEHSGKVRDQKVGTRSPIMFREGLADVSAVRPSLISCSDYASTNH